ncbi:MAG: hypothetical protein PHU56_03040 [Candidatus Pacebacteria bacterium]|nr:hypothetical protein [Candidatus Paceibacterota bacterium]
MTPRKIKALASLGIFIFLAVEISGIILVADRLDSAAGFIIACLILAFGVIFFYVFFGYLGPHIMKISESRNFKCRKCGHLFPFSSVCRTTYPFSLFDQFVFYAIIYSVFNVSFFTKCPNCHKRSWCKLDQTEKSV